MPSRRTWPSIPSSSRRTTTLRRRGADPHQPAAWSQPTEEVDPMTSVPPHDEREPNEVIAQELAQHDWSTFDRAFVRLLESAWRGRQQREREAEAQEVPLQTESTPDAHALSP